MELKGIKGIGDVTLGHLNELNINTALELLHFFPKKYKLYCVDNILNNDGYSTLHVIVETKPYFMSFRKDIYTVIFYTTVNGIKIKCVMFGKAYLRTQIIKDRELIIYGRYKADIKEFDITKIFTDVFEERVEIDYQEKNIKNYSFTRAVKAVYACNLSFEEEMPLELVEKYKLLPENLYLYYSHMASNKKEYIQVIRRRKYEEFFWYAMSLNLLSYNRHQIRKPIRYVNTEYYESFINGLSFNLTNDQLKAIDDIHNDLISYIPMNRLVQGDVGCGKSIVALVSCLMMLECGYQVAVMVPTEILANQQYQYFEDKLKSLGYNVALLTSSTAKKDKKIILDDLYNGNIQLIVGTHSLIEDNVEFNNLGLIIIDEQHKFGVDQRRRLVDKFKNVDSLYLSATPIPRTLGLTEFGDLDISSIETMPSGRIPVKTKIVDYRNLDRMIDFLNERIANGEQIYVVVPHVLESESYNAMDVDTAYRLFSDRINGTVLIAHGKMKAKDKDEAMSRFSKHEADVLISTTVIEVGVNVVNATVMVIMDANMFGLAQMHQLRGRVGRADKKSYCFLVTNDLDNQRLQILQQTNNGFEIAQMDYEMRGSGDYLGDSQSGKEGLDYASFIEDKKIWSCAKADADIYIDKFMNREITSKKFDELYKLSLINKGINN